MLRIGCRKLQVESVMPIHGRPVPYSQFLESVLTMTSMTTRTPQTRWGGES